jgi:hypothetical protein
MNWRNPFLVTYLSVTAAGTAILGYLVYSAWSNAEQVDVDYTAAVSKLQSLQNRQPYPSDENNAKYVEYTKQYRAEYDKLVARVANMQKPLETVSPQAFQDRLRADVSQVEQAAKENNVKLQEGFYLGFDQYRGTLPSDAAAGPLARELAAIRSVVDQLVQFKVREITGIQRELLPEEGGRQAAPEPTPRPRSTGSSNRPPAGNRSQPAQPARNVVSTSTFEVSFVADQAATRGVLDAIANSPQFFVIRYLNVANSSQEGPPRGASAPPPEAAPAAEPGATPAQPGVTVLAGRETLAVSLRIEMVTFNNLPATK